MCKHLAGPKHLTPASKSTWQDKDQWSLSATGDEMYYEVVTHKHQATLPTSKP